MPRAEVGSTKHIANKMKSKGLQRLRWYCQVCERQMRDENGFKCHTQSEGHVRQMLVVGENSNKFISDYSNQFKHDFLQLLRTSHGEKKVNLNHFYNNYIANKEHVHMNATRWPSLTEFGKYLGREGICRVEEGERGLEVAWIDNSPEALRRQDAIRKKERQDKGDEEREQRLVADQVERARRDAEKKGSVEQDEEAHKLQRTQGEKLKLDFGKKPALESPPLTQIPSPPNSEGAEATNSQDSPPSTAPTDMSTEQSKPTASKFGMKLGGGNKPQNVFAAASKKNALASKAAPKVVTTKSMSEAERIMKEEIDRKKRRETGFANGNPAKRMRI